MKTKYLTAGTTVQVRTSTDEFDYTLNKDDILDLIAGDWEEVGMSILYIITPERKRKLKLIRAFLYGRAICSYACRL